MNIYDNIPKSTTTFSEVVVYPFNIDTYINITIEKTLAEYNLIYNEKYIEEKMGKLSKILEKEKQIYVRTAQELISKFSSEIMITSENNDFHKMSKYVIDNFVYILKVRGWDVVVYYGIYKDDIGIDEITEYYVQFKISPLFISKL